MNEPEPCASRRGLASRSRAAGHHRETLFERVNDRFGLVLVSLVATFIVLACGLTTDWILPVTVALESATLLAVFAAARVDLRMQRIARVVATIFVVAALFAIPGIGSVARLCTALLSALLASVCPIVIARSIVRRRIIDVRAVLGALCIYVLIGLFFAFVYTATGAIAHQFFTQLKHARSSDYVYFSFVTQTTVGYGDLTAANGFGRACAVLEALIGQIYLVTVIAVLVSNLVPRRGELPPSDGRGGY